MFSAVLTHAEGPVHDEDKLKHIEVCMRMIGHEFLLQSGDSTSRVLPIRRDGHTFRISFDTELGVKPNILSGVVDSVIEATGLSEHYFVALEKCGSDSLVHMYEVNSSLDANIVPCGPRDQEKDCYQIAVSLMDDQYAMLRTDAAFIDKTHKSQSTDYQFWGILLLMLAVAAAVSYYYRRKARQTEKVFIHIGDYAFDPKGLKLIHGEQRIELSHKEAELLSVLQSSINEVLERDLILNKVWGDDGNYVGRTLDVFISKLRKKLEADPRIKISNIRGVGYKLIVDA